jgi:hypothetical protein
LRTHLLRRPDPASRAFIFVVSMVHAAFFCAARYADVLRRQWLSYLFTRERAFRPVIAMGCAAVAHMTDTTLDRARCRIISASPTARRPSRARNDAPLKVASGKSFHRRDRFSTEAKYRNHQTGEIRSSIITSRVPRGIPRQTSVPGSSDDYRRRLAATGPECCGVARLLVVPQYPKCDVERLRAQGAFVVRLKMSYSPTIQRARAFSARSFNTNRSSLAASAGFAKCASKPASKAVSRSFSEA